MNTSAWVAVADRAEVSHEQVVSVSRARRGRLVTGYHVLDETWTVMRYRHGLRVAEKLVTGIRSGIARIEVSAVADLEVAAMIGTIFAYQDFSLSDRTSWAVMERLGIHDAIIPGQRFPYLPFRSRPAPPFHRLTLILRFPRVFRASTSL